MLEKQLQNYRLTTAVIIYHLPDHPHVLQTFLWQEYDLAPHYPELSHFLKFWSEHLEGSIHSVTIATQQLISPALCIYAKGEFQI